MKIALDAMGGDFGPSNIVGGAAMALKEYRHIERLFLVGDTPQIEAELKKLKCNDRRIEIVHATQVVDMCDRAVDAVRRKKDSSVSRAVDLVKKGDAPAERPQFPRQHRRARPVCRSRGGGRVRRICR